MTEEGGGGTVAVCVHCVGFCEAAVENYATIVQLQMQNNQIKRAGQEARKGGKGSRQVEEAVCQCVFVSACVFVYVCLPAFVRVCLHLACLLSSLGSSNLAIIQLKLPALTTSLPASAPLHSPLPLPCMLSNIVWLFLSQRRANSG